MSEAFFNLVPCYTKSHTKATKSDRLLVPALDTGVDFLVADFQYEGGYNHPTWVGPFSYNKTLVVQSGRLRITTDDGRSEELGPQQVFFCGAGRRYQLQALEAGRTTCIHTRVEGGPIPFER